MRDNLPNMLRAAAKEWRTGNKVVATGATRYDSALEEAASAIEELEKLTDAQLDIIKQYQAYLGKARWIPATERLPEYGTTVLVYGSQGGIYTARYERAKAEWGRDSWWKLNSKSHICNPTHWVPLPEPPKGA